MSTFPPRKTVKQLMKEIGGKITSRADKNYNCIAWSVGEKGRFIWPEFSNPRPTFDGNNGRKGHYWPFGDQDSTLGNFLTFYEGEHGFSRCSPPEPGPSKHRERVVLYCYYSCSVLWVAHASRQRPDGQWESKLGVDEDIVHKRPEDLQDYYGCPLLQFLERPRPASSTPKRRIIHRSR